MTPPLNVQSKILVEEKLEKSLTEALNILASPGTTAPPETLAHGKPLLPLTNKNITSSTNIKNCHHRFSICSLSKLKVVKPKLIKNIMRYKF